MSVSEARVQTMVADYLRLQYPDVLFHSDFGSSVGMTARQGAYKKRQNGGRRGWPDMFIAQKRIWMIVDDMPQFCFDNSYPVRPFEYYLEGAEYAAQSAGLFLELKKDGTRLKKKNGEWANEHIAEQAKVLEDLRQRGYCAEFAVGFDEAKKIIDEYLGGGIQ